MSLKSFFKPIKPEVLKSIEAPFSLRFNTSVFTEQFPDYKSAKAALIGVGESKGAPDNKGTKKAPDKIRAAFYKLKSRKDFPELCDLGNLILSPDYDKTLAALGKVCKTLQEAGTVPIIIGGSRDVMIGQFGAFELMNQSAAVLHVSAHIDAEAEEDTPPNRNFIRRLLTNEKYIKKYIHLAHQSYLIDESHLQFLKKDHIEMYRLGNLRGNIKETEPLLRCADMFSFDLSAVRQSDAPGTGRPLPFGLTAEEACQICRYAGAANTISSFGFYDVNPNEDPADQTSSTVAVMLWYLLEGFSLRPKQNGGFNSDGFRKFSVTFHEKPGKIIFFRHKKNNQWWMEVSGATKGQPEGVVIPCSYDDYRTALNGEIPDRWVKAQQYAPPVG